MKFLSTALLFASYFLSGRCADDEAVVTLTTENFDSFIKENGKVLVEFYAPWCGHCKALAPEYEKAAQAIAADDSLDVVLAKVDATEEKDLSSKFGVKGFPTLKFFTGDVEKPSDYSGGRTESTILSWVRTRSLPAVSMLETSEALDTFKSKSKITLVGFFGKDSDESKVLAEVAEANRESVTVGQVTSDDVKVEGCTTNLCLFRDFEEAVVAYEGDFNAEGIAAFLDLERFPLIDAIGPENYRDYVDRGLPLVWIALNPSEEEAKDALVERLTPFAKEAKGKLSFTWVDADKFQQHVQNLGISSVPGLMIAGEGNKKFLFSADIESSDDLKTFFDGYAAGTLPLHLKSEPVPKSNDEPVFVLVGSEFDKVVGQDKDVFVEFYAPWCGHCKRLAPEYEKVGEAFSDVDSVVIAKLDATENDTPEEIKGFPTLIFYPKGKTEGIKYNGDRKQDAIIDWIKSKASDPASLSSLKQDL